jgi:hypothetical protein
VGKAPAMHYPTDGDPCLDQSLRVQHPMRGSCLTKYYVVVTAASGAKVNGSRERAQMIVEKTTTSNVYKADRRVSNGKSWMSGFLRSSAHGFDSSVPTQGIGTETSGVSSGPYISPRPSFRVYIHLSALQVALTLTHRLSDCCILC